MRPSSAFPLTWPPNTARTKTPEKSRFETGFTRSRERLYDELRKMGGTNVMISSNMPLKRNGEPYAAGGRGISDAGVAVYWRAENGSERVMACDRWDEAGDNVHAIALSIAALRGIERWGGSSIVERAFSGFAALGDGSAINMPPPEPPVEEVWREVLGLAPNDDIEIARVRYKKLAMQFHPDRNGGDSTNHVPMQRVIAAWKIASRELR